MKVNQVNNSPAITPTKDAASGSTRTTGTSSAGATRAAHSSSQNDGTPSLSVQQVSRQVGSGDFDAARVGQIRAAIQNGSLKMDASKIADGVLSDAQSLLSAQTKAV
ncbi:flagellar biosynthesis anti-sigma factor FlgM [Ralstonia solanacearum]|uniref:Negative regulator of flagellin synthesis n=1 Tax=Ralstonia solanacearum (strain Po82) TaxID=1031711 RepID=F6GAY1_RALS8|nr:flagellar biosynthesis anti-sigma factor FlgM [Ralstonia solanacearum]AEG72114.1 negative regulator of flagellin synthesis (anti-sigma-28 factor) protein [Ralstonia solanacearum Po82]AMP71314.1 flagellar biosynthesis anti-sigma factor FlgM [Ralstonia solanacearum]AMP76757.1 flagellar biosynthesis anti-sigma factor FlgM [Ralstonia solanacearum]AYB63344.1 flagellar biosynthesis anti-sigma factor FlgM [Ralstonia solanacearum]EUJ12066.1 anti-sigma-28 factor FlgM [Ralstonia solanacearum P673]